MMRIDKYLKLSMLVKRRTIAQEMTEIGAVRVNKRQCKPAANVSEGDIVEIAYPRRVIEVKVLCADEAQLRRKKMPVYEIISETRVNSEEKPW